MYLPTIMSNKSNFSIKSSEEAKLAKISAMGNEVALEALKKRKPSSKMLPSSLHP
jgi:hypothetical protein